MKRFVCLICGCFLLVSAIGQGTSLCIATDKTTSLIFPFAIRHVDRGTKDVLVQKVKEADNILLVKAASKDFPETNLSVVTDDGSIYSFAICYENKPAIWIYNLPANGKVSIATYANGILDNPRRMRGTNDRRWDMETEIIGIYIKDNTIYYQLRVTNQSPIDYDIDLLRFFIRDKKKGKRTAAQENELKPLYIAGNTLKVKARNNNVIVVALDKFTIPDAKYLGIQVMEKNGGRHLFVKLRNRQILKAIALPDLR
ncbi:MAG: conjugative transposon protein TraN [Chitinophagaceae bacterium]